MRFFSKLLVVGFSSLLLLNIAFAGTSPAFSIRGGYPHDQKDYFKYQITPGSTLRDGILVMNRSEDQTATIEISTNGVVNENIQPVDGKVVGIPLYWIDFGATEVTLEPMSTQIVDFTVTVPEDATIANYETILNAILIRQTDLTGAGVSVRLGVGKQMAFDVIEGEASDIERRVLPDEPVEVDDKASGPNPLWKVYHFLQERFEIILIFLIILLLGKMILDRNKK